ncbi:MAG: MTH938/NDUFAF3 family protein [Candidatus Bilamarchaeaceae archaeon]
MIEKYDFGVIVINGKEYKKDVLLFEDKVFPNWWRKEGHHLYLADLEKILKLNPTILVIGTGYSGVMVVDNEVGQYCKEEGIKLIMEKTGEAVKAYNSMLGKSVAGALHLTC